MEKWHKLALFVAFVVSATLAVEARYASSGFVKQVEQRLDQKINTDRLDNLQERIWKLEDRYGLGCETCPSVVKDEYRELQKEYEFLLKKIKEE
jgi:hypothetical protein